MQEINRETLRTLRREIDEALRPIAKQYNISLACGNGAYGGANGHLKVEVAIKSADGSVLNKEAQAFKTLAPQYGLQASDLGTNFTSRGKTFKIVGLKPQSYKYPILAEEVTGLHRTFKFPSEHVKAKLADAMRA